MHHQIFTALTQHPAAPEVSAEHPATPEFSAEAESCCAGGSPLQHWHLLIIKGMKKTSAHHAFPGL